MATVTGKDPLLVAQWHLKTLLGNDPNKIWSEFDGSSVKVGIYDDGIDKTVKDLQGTYDASRELVFGGVRADPSKGSGVHGTAVAGIIGASANNGVGGVGIAHGASLTSIDIFSGSANYNFIASIRAMSQFDVTNNSWGWSAKYSDNAAVAGSFGKQFIDALAFAADTGRGGKGTIIVNAVGNDNLSDNRDANTSEYNAARQTITVGAIGQDGDVSAYSTRGASVLVSGPTNGGGAGITTTDRSVGGYSATDATSSFGGTSAAAPMVTGIVSLMLDASNNTLGWRDVQDILSYTADHTTPAALTGGISGRMEYGWTINKADNANGGGLHYSNDVGYGMTDGFEAVRYAEVWSKFGVAEVSANEAKASVAGTVNKAIADKATLQFTAVVSQAIEIEHADLTLTLTHANINDLRIELISPEGTRSIVLDVGTGVNYVANNTWTFGTDALRGELSKGIWTIRITDTKTGAVGSVASYRLDVYGDAPSSNDVYHYNDEFFKMLALDPARGTLKDLDGGIDWINASANIDNTVINLNAGQASTWAGKTAFTIASGTVIENAVTGDGYDTLIGNASANELMGMRGNDLLEGRGGADILDGGMGIDTATYVSSTGGVDVDMKRATQIGGDAQGDMFKSIENVTGSALADILRGDDAVNILQGGKGYDLLEGRGGADVLDGGEGIDTVTYALSKVGVDIDMKRATQLGGEAQGDTLKSIENVTGSSFADFLRGDDALNILQGGKGNDVIEGRGGADVLDGGEGVDTATYAFSILGVDVDMKRATQIGGDAKGDTLKSIENVTGSGLADFLRGDDTLNFIQGGKGNDVIEGRGGADILDGGEGIDILSYINSGGAVQINLATKAVTSSDAAGDVISNFENVQGSRFGDILRGDAGANVLRGEDGNDTLYGFDGDDLIIGGTGNDTLYGGSGKDVFQFLKAEGLYGTDVCADFVQGQDKISLLGYGLSFSKLTVTSWGSYSSVDFANDGGTLMVMTTSRLADSDFFFI